MGARATACCLAWEPRSAGGRVTAEHDGYARLPDTLSHRRTVDLDGASRSLAVREDIVATGEHEVAVYFQLSEQCRLEAVESHRLRVTLGETTLTLELDPGLAVTMLAENEHEIARWVSRGYHQKTRATTVRGHARCQGPASFSCRTDAG